MLARSYRRIAYLLFGETTWRHERRGTSATVRTIAGRSSVESLFLPQAVVKPEMHVSGCWIATIVLWVFIGVGFPFAINVLSVPHLRRDYGGAVDDPLRRIRHVRCFDVVSCLVKDAVSGTFG